MLNRADSRLPIAPSFSSFPVSRFSSNILPSVRASISGVALAPLALSEVEVSPPRFLLPSPDPYLHGIHDGLLWYKYQIPSATGPGDFPAEGLFLVWFNCFSNFGCDHMWKHGNLRFEGCPEIVAECGGFSTQKSVLASVSLSPPSGISVCQSSIALARVLLDIPLRSLKSKSGSMEMVITGPG